MKENVYVPDAYAALRAPGVQPRPPLYRRRPRVLGGVCRGLSVHLGGSVGFWRFGFVLCAFFGIGLLLYFALWIFVPWYRRESEVAAQNQRLAQGLNFGLSSDERDASRSWLLLVATLLAASAFFLFSVGIGQNSSSFSILGSVILILIGAGIIWSIPIKPNDGESATDKLAPVAQLSAARKVIATIGGAISVIGAVFLVAGISPNSPLLISLTTAVVTIMTLSLVLYPVMARLKYSLRETAAQKARESVRADMAAHLHDSVLQTLALIRARCDSPDTVRTLARMQEQDLRKYLYADRADEDTSTAQMLLDISQEVERRYQQEINCVITGDCVPDASARTVLAAAREALINACKYGGDGEISLYAELHSDTGANSLKDTFGASRTSVEANFQNSSLGSTMQQKQSLQVWIRDRGPGFDLATVPADRAGIRDSIIGRMERVGGKATLRSPLPSGGTEVHLEYSG